MGGSSSSATKFISVYGQLTPQGSALNPVVFTSERDDEYGGDTNNDLDATSPNPGDWGHLYFNSNANFASNIQNCIFRYGGKNTGDPYMMRINKLFQAHPDMTIQNCTFSHSSEDAIYVGGQAEPTISQNNFSEINGHGINNQSNYPLNAENNYWDSSSGPTHPDNPEAVE